MTNRRTGQSPLVPFSDKCRPPDIRADATGWCMVGSSVRGAAHCRKGKPNQDALGWWPESGNGVRAALAVADGHGDERSARSADGSRLAVDAGLAVVKATLARAAVCEPDALVQIACDEWPMSVVGRWREAVSAHFERQPLPARLTEDFAAAAMLGGRPPDPFSVYGTTLLLAVATPDVIACLQLGDGDLLVVADDGVVSRPVPADARLVANVTTSLSAESAAEDIRISVLMTEGKPPALVLASTDGYANSFSTDADFLQVGRDLLALIRAEGLGSVRQHLETWLAESSEAGSGDDVTLGIMCRGDLAGEAK